ncbi:hypothetical protein [Pseudomonas aeruginosa]|uniref:hypothetical protein n=1 Tax=Pseudomonas aeruginosa TaxID=287 RepID=UPI003135CC2F
MLPVTQSEPFEGLTDTIENGYFVFTLMPSLYCPYNCKHCYLSKEQRSDKTLMSLDDFRMVCRKIHTYFEEQQPPRRTIIAYNYGGEPTAAGPELRISRSSGHPFHEHLTTDSTVIRPPIPRASGH